MNFPILSSILWAPLLGAIIILFVSEKRIALIRGIAVGFSSIALLLSVWIFASYDRTIGGFQFIEHVPWVPSLGMNYALGVDGLSVPMVLLTALILFCGVFVSWNVTERTKEFFFYMLALVSGVLGFYMARDLFVMFLFLEVAVIPKFILIDIWGSKNKEYAALKYTLYLLAGSAVAMVAIICVYIYAGDVASTVGYFYADGSSTYTFDIDTLSRVTYHPVFQKIVFLLFLIGFGVFIPIFPVHRWTPDGHSAAPTAISMLLAGVIMKLGGYAMIRVAINFFPEGAQFWAPLIAVLATINAVYIAFVAMVQKDVKYLVANSSVSHMGYVLIGIASLNSAALTGAAAQMFAHGIMAALFFVLVGNIYEKTHTRMIADFGGLAHQMPRVAVAFIIAGLASLGLPGTFNFAAEFSIFVGAMRVFPVLATLSIFAIVLTSIYVLRVVQQIFYGARNPRWDHIQDAKGIEMVPIVVLVATLIWFGFFPHQIMHLQDSGLLSIVQKFVSFRAGGLW